MNARFRFAPSPTGYVHIGSLRTVLFGYMMAKKLGGKFILRIEDTDQARYVEGAQENLIQIFDWLGLGFDEGPHMGGAYGPYVQMERLDIYKKYIQELINKDGAYRCFCTPERVDALRAQQAADKLPPRYDSHCRDLSKEESERRASQGESFVVRQKNPKSGEIVVRDELRGEIKINSSELDDHILLKNTGIPTYHFAHIVDDHLMEITHVTRSDEWLPSLPKHWLLYELFGWQKPLFYHFPVILNKFGGGKLSKRSGDVAVEQYRQKGYLPKALLNFNALLGWHPKGDEEVYELDKLIDLFEIKAMSSSPAVFDQDKLDYFNGVYIRKLPEDELYELSLPFVQNLVHQTNTGHKKEADFIKAALRTEQERVCTLSEFTEALAFYFKDDVLTDSSLLAWKDNSVQQSQDNLRLLLEEIKNYQGAWDQKELNDYFIAWIKEQGYKNGDFLWPMRVALSGQKNSPSPFEIASVLGREETESRLQKAINL